MDIEKSKISLMIELHNDIIASAKVTIDKAIQLGTMLKEVKGALEYGKFTEWINENLPFTDRTARNYMKLSENKNLIGTETVSEAYKMLQKPKDTFIQDVMDKHKEIMNSNDVGLLKEWMDVLKELTKMHSEVVLDCEVKIGELLNVTNYLNAKHPKCKFSTNKLEFDESITKEEWKSVYDDLLIIGQAVKVL